MIAMGVSAAKITNRASRSVITCLPAFRVPDAVQREAVHRTAGTVPDAAFATVPGLQRITKMCCAAPGHEIRLLLRPETDRLDDPGDVRALLLDRVGKLLG